MQTKSSIVTNDFAYVTIICVECIIQNLTFMSHGNFSVSPRSLLLVIQCCMLFGKLLLDDYSELRSMENTHAGHCGPTKSTIDLGSVEDNSTHQCT